MIWHDVHVMSAWWCNIWSINSLKVPKKCEATSVLMVGPIKVVMQFWTWHRILCRNVPTKPSKKRPYWITSSKSLIHPPKTNTDSWQNKTLVLIQAPFVRRLSLSFKGVHPKTILLMVQKSCKMTYGRIKLVINTCTSTGVPTIFYQRVPEHIDSNMATENRKKKHPLWYHACPAYISWTKASAPDHPLPKKQRLLTR